ncbi:MAG: futalosine hydrolase [Geobacteraceae bacterium]|nr:futalosine hydrolase [Geobacteraceae bacterium]
METIVVSAATDGELSNLIGRIGAQKLSSQLPMDLHALRTSHYQIIIAKTGMGKAMAASTTTALIHGFSPVLIINTGCAGAYAGCGLETGNLALATCEIFADEGIETPEGWQSLEQMGFALWEKNGIGFGNEIPLSAALVGEASRVAARYGFKFKAGKFLTVSTCSGSRMRGEVLIKRYGGVCENMEGAAVALTASRYGIPCLEVRGISNIVEDRDLSRWDIPLAVTSASDFIERFLESV